MDDILAHTDLLDEARSRYEDGENYDRENRENAFEDLKFRAGEQWPDTIAQERVEDDRPMLTINRLPTIINQITGDARVNRPSIKVRPSDDKSDPALAEVFTGLIRSIENASEASTAYIHALDCAATCGIGHWRVLTRFTDDDMFEQDLLIRPIRNPLAVVWDPGAQLMTREDARWCFVVDLLTKERFRELYPDARYADFEFEDLPDYLHGWYRNEHVRVAEYWRKVDVTRTLAQLQNGAVVDITDKSPEVLSTLPIHRERKVQSHKVEQYVVSGAEVLNGPNEWAGKHIPIVPVIGEEIAVGDRVVRHGIVRHAKDPQRMYNYWITAQAEFTALQPKAPYKLTPTQIEGHEADWREANVRNFPYLLYNPDEMAPPPQREPPPMASAAMDRQAMIAADDMKATTGVFDAAMGARSNETSGRAIRAREQQSDTATAVYPGNMARAVGHTGRILVDLIPKIFDTQRTVRLLNEDDTEGFAQVNTVVTGPDGPVVFNDLTVGRYDVVVLTGPSFNTRRIEAVEGMLGFIQAFPQSGALIADLIAKNQDWPGADKIAERLRFMLPPELRDDNDGQPPAPEPPDPAVAAKMAEMMAKIEKLNAETQGKELENAEKQLGIAMAGGLDAAVRQIVMQVIGEALAQPAGPATGGPPQGAPPLQPAMPLP